MGLRVEVPLKKRMDWYILGFTVTGDVRLFLRLSQKYLKGNWVTVAVYV